MKLLRTGIESDVGGVDLAVWVRKTNVARTFVVSIIRWKYSNGQSTLRRVIFSPPPVGIMNWMILHMEIKTAGMTQFIT